jgi:putative pyruvate formate lyase activating enzyme
MGLLAPRIERIEQHLRSCELCPWRCLVDRLSGEQGYCRLGAQAPVFHHYLSYSEEREISPTYEVLFAGCSHRCRFCSVLPQVERPASTRPATLDELRRGLAAARARGCRTLSLVGGEPTVNLLGALRLLDALECDLPVVWNSNMFMTEVVHEALAGVVHTFVADVHWGNDGCAREIGLVAPYFEEVTGSVERAASYARVVLRHLLVPGHLVCCFQPVARWARERLPEVPFRVLDSYWPNGHAQGPLARSLPRGELEQALAFAHDLGLRLVPESAQKWTIPGTPRRS